MAPEERDLRGVVSYQARIPVERDGEIYLIEVSLPDWEEDRVILRGLASRYGVGTVGEVKSVETVKEMESEKCEFETDGLIFTHKEYPAIYKWKPKEMITIDLFCIRVGTQAVVCASKYKH
jgi:hypothetical protein